jgi:hypothetical protein
MPRVVAGPAPARSGRSPWRPAGWWPRA